MTDYLTEQEQVELLKSWIKEYTPVILTGIVVAAIGIFGWHYWQERQNNMMSHASTLYMDLLGHAKEQPKVATDEAQQLFKNYPKTIYGQMAAFILAKEAVQNKNNKEAHQYYDWVLSHTSEPAFKQIARLRDARLLISEKQMQKSLALLNEVDDQTFAGLINEVRGDAYLELKDKTRAREYYHQALLTLPNADSVRPLLQIKYDNLAPAK